MESAATAWEGAPAEQWRSRWQVPDVVILPVTRSTNDVGRELASAGAAAGTVVIADEQTAGRGRFGRPWTAPPGRALLLSVVLRPDRSAAGRLPSTAPIRVGLATARALESVTRVPARLKWPNDVVVVDQGKIAGILCEASAGSDADSAWVVAGVGINTGQTADEFAAEMRDTATSVRRITGRAPSRASIAGALIDALRPFRLRDLLPLDQDELDEYDRRDALRGARVQTDAETGIADGLAQDGALRLITADGLCFVRAGSVRLAAEAGSARSTSAVPGIPSTEPLPQRRP